MNIVPVNCDFTNLILKLVKLSLILNYNVKNIFQIKYDKLKVRNQKSTI
jgi:hypothetical protein